MNTMQAGGLPGKVVGGVPMLGCHAQPGSFLSFWAGYWLLKGARQRSTIGNTIVMKDGAPVLSLGSPGNVHCSIPQMLSLILDSGITPPEASAQVRIIPMDDDLSIGVEGRLSVETVTDLAKLGILTRATKPWDPWTGIFEIAWRDTKTGLMNAITDQRWSGVADGM
ncbi:MAG: gamma-glutamyltransferase [Deltaproteobacteria bacterium]|nr:gamma-glutamyltransferase [Deltaproteobacteria bacterium]